MSQLIVENRIPWTRFWVPWNGRISCDSDGKGFLHDPKSFLKADFALYELPQLLKYNFLVLSGPPGIGKTIELKNIQDHLAQNVVDPETIIAFHCRCIGSDTSLYRETIASPKWEKATKNNQSITLLIDGIDEGLARVPTLLDSLTHWFRDQPTDKIRLILACRVASWDELSGNELQNLWPKQHQGGLFELCPLRRLDAELAARHYGLDHEAFIRAVYNNHLTGLAARPITLRLLLNEFKQIGYFSSSHESLFTTAVRTMCKEIDQRRAKRLTRPPPSPDQIYQTASRIAAILILCGKNTICRLENTEVQQADLMFPEILHGYEISEDQKFKVTEQTIDSALDTPLFSFRGPGKYGFDHQTYAEILTADYLRKATLPQLKKLLCRRLNDVDLIIPQLAETAAWLSISHADFREFLLTTQPEILLRADATSLNIDVKKRAISSLLDRVDKELAFDEETLRRFYPTWSHPDLDSQLHPYISDTKRNVVVRRMAIDIAGSAKIRSLETVLWQALRAEKNESLRRKMAATLEELANDNSEEKLSGLLSGKFGPDPALDLRGSALRALVPKYRTITDILHYLDDPVDHSYIGSYYTAIFYHLPEHLTCDDLPALLKKLASWNACFSHTSVRRNLAERTLLLALRYSADRHIADLLVNMWITKVRSEHPLPSTTQSDFETNKPALADREIRRKFAKLLLDHDEVEGTDIQPWRTHVLDQKDIQWLLGEIIHSPIHRRQVWATTISSFAYSEQIRENPDLLNQRCSEIVELRTSLPDPGKFTITEKLRRLGRARQLRHLRRESSWQKEESPQLTRREALDSAFDHIRKGNADGWYWIAVNAYAEDRSDKLPKSTISHSDITSSPGWHSLTAIEREEARQAARQFLLNKCENRRDPFQITSFGIAGFHAVWLLRHELKVDSELRKSVKNKWLPAIIDRGMITEKDTQELINLANQLDPAFTKERFLSDLLADDSKHNHPESIRKYSQCWDSGYTTAALTVLFEHSIQSATLKGIIGFLAIRDRHSLERSIPKLIEQFKPFTLDTPTRRALLIAILFNLPENNWNLFKDTLSKSQPIRARAAFLESIWDLTYRESNVFGRLKDEQIADLYILLTSLFPPERFSERSSASGTVEPKHQIPDLREGCLSILVNRATESSCTQIERAIARLPKRYAIWVKWHLKEAEKIRLRKSWSEALPAPLSVLKMLQSDARRIIDSEDDLIAAISDSLTRLRENLHRGEFPMVRALWNEPSIRSKSKPTHKEETALSDFLNDWLEKDLGPTSGICVNREVQFSRQGRLDLKIEATSRSSSAKLIVFIEVKCDSNRKIDTSCSSQLVGQYLARGKCSHGIYLIGLFSEKSKFWNSAHEASIVAEKWASDAAGTSYFIRSEILDCRLYKR